MNFVKILPDEILFGILMNPNFDNRDLVNFGRVSRDCYAITYQDKLLASLFPFELIPVIETRRNYIFNHTIASLDELDNRIENIVVKLKPIENLEFTASYINLRVSLAFATLLGKNLVEGSYFPYGVNLQKQCLKLHAWQEIKSVNIVDWFDQLMSVRPLKPAFTYQFKRDENFLCQKVNFLFRNALTPAYFSDKFESEVLNKLSEQCAYQLCLDSSLEFPSKGSVKIKYFDIDNCPMMYLTESDFLSFDEFFVRFIVQLLENLTGKKEVINDLGSLRSKYSEFLLKYKDKILPKISQDQILEVANHPEIYPLLTNLLDRLNDVRMRIEAIKKRDLTVSISDHSQKLVLFTDKYMGTQEERGAEVTLKFLFMFFLTIYNLDFYAN